MSILKWFGNLFAGIGKSFRDLMKKAKPFLIKEIPVVIGIVNSLKFAVETGGPFIAAVIPGDADDKIIAKANKILPKLLVELKLFNISVQSNSNEEIFKAVIAYLQTITKDKRKGKYLEIANYLTVALVDGKLSWSEIVHTVQIAYDEKINESVAA